MIKRLLINIEEALIIFKAVDTSRTVVVAAFAHKNIDMFTNYVNFGIAVDKKNSNPDISYYLENS